MAEFKPVKYVIFDMDGLLLNSEDVYCQTFRDVLSTFGAEYPDALRVKVMGTVPKDTHAILVKELNLPIEPSEFTKLVDEKLHERMQNLDLMPGAERLVKHLKANGVPIAVATSSGKDTFAIKTRKHKEFFDLFHHIVVGSSDPEVKHGKPAPDIFLVCASRFDTPANPDECLVFEDAPNGVQGAVSAGMQVVMVPDVIVPEEKKTLATCVINSLLEFKPQEFGLPPFDN